MGKKRDTAPIDLHGKLWLERAGRDFLSEGRIALLEQIGRTGSISQAAKAAGISYKTAWDMVDQMNNLSDRPLVLRQTGGQHGGGTQLTEHGARLIEMYRVLAQRYRRLLSDLAEGVQDFEHFVEWRRRLAMKVSMRNQLHGRVTDIRRGAVNTEVALSVGGGDVLTAMITSAGADQLGIAIGSEVIALFKESSVFLAIGEQAPVISARNRLLGTVNRCEEGAVNGEVVIELPGGKTIASIISNHSLRGLGIKRGSRVWACIKASDVMLAAND